MYCIRHQIPVLYLLVHLCSSCMADVVNQEVEVHEGAPVNLNCYSEKGDQSSFEWFFRGIQIEPSNKYKPSTTKIHSGGISYSLHINNVERIDQGLYTYQDKFEKHTKCCIQLYVSYIIGNPSVGCTLFQTNTSGPASQKKDIHSSLMEVACTAFIGSKVFVNTTIYKSYENQILIPLHYNYEKQTGALESVSVSYSVDVKGLNGWKFWCVAEHERMLQPVNCSTSLLLKPVVNITQSNQELLCEAKSYPNITRVFWKACEKSGFNNESGNCTEIKGTGGNQLPLSSIEPPKDKLILVCEAVNIIGTGNAHFEFVRVDANANNIKLRKSSMFITICIIVPLIIIVCIFIIFVYKRRGWKYFNVDNKVNSKGTGIPITPSDDQASETLSNLYGTPMLKDRPAKEMTNNTCEQQPLYHILESNTSA